MTEHATDMDLLLDGMERLGIVPSSLQQRQFAIYMAEIALFNSTYRLVGAEGRDFVVKHLLDSLAPLDHIASLLNSCGPESILCDVGSGAGLPGIPLAIMLADTSVFLVERSGRRCGFLRNVVASCNLDSRVAVIQSDLSEVVDTFDVVTFRAFHPLVDIIRPIGNVIADRGYVCAYKGRIESVEAELLEVGNLVREGKTPEWTSRTIPLSVPFLDAPRTMVVMQKGGKDEEM
jgi:16S rRNA (guanine527-N7)-methyltransferase